MAEIWRARTETRWLKFQTIDIQYIQLPKQSGGYFGPLNSYEDSDADLPQVPCLYLQNVSLVTFGTGPLFAVVIRCSHSLLTSQPNRVKSQCDCRWLPATGCHIAIVPPSDVCWFINPMNTIVISAINHSEMGVASFKAGVPGQAEDLAEKPRLCLLCASLGWRRHRQQVQISGWYPLVNSCSYRKWSIGSWFTYIYLSK